MRSSTLPAALILGNASDPHFVDVVAAIASSLVCRAARDAAAADYAIADLGRDPTIVLLLQSRPGEFTAAEIVHLRRRWPLARFVAIAGSWCEGESRSGRTLDGVYRIAWTAAVPRLTRDLAALAEHRGSLAAPATASAEERFLATPGTLPSNLVIAVAGLRRAFTEPLIEALAAAGATAFHWPLDGRPLALGVGGVVWDLAGCEQRLTELHSLMPKTTTAAPIVAIADFPRPQDVIALAALGVSHVLSKPLVIDDLLECIGSGAMRERLGETGIVQSNTAAA